MKNMGKTLSKKNKMKLFGLLFIFFSFILTSCGSNNYFDKTCLDWFSYTTNNGSNYVYNANKQFDFITDGSNFTHSNSKAVFSINNSNTQVFYDDIDPINLDFVLLNNSHNSLVGTDGIMY